MSLRASADQEWSRARLASASPVVRSADARPLARQSTSNSGASPRRACRAWIWSSDELGYLPFGQAGGALLFHLLCRDCEHTSVIFTTNLNLTG